METQKLSFTSHAVSEVLLGSNILTDIGARLSRLGAEKRCLVITDELVAKWYLQPLIAELQQRRFEVFETVIANGEDTKNMGTVEHLLQQMAELELARNSLVIGLGGGVIGDLAGFAAAIFKRGVPFVFLPTSLLAMTDACIGGKTGINTPNGKNLIGTFSQPVLIGIDLQTLRTLPLSQMSYGLVEAIKHAVLADSAYFKFIARHIESIKSKDMEFLKRLVRRSINIKKTFVERDERETGDRALLNLGHTFGHAFELLGEYRRYHHGEAVGLGMLLALRISHNLGLLQKDYLPPLTELLRALNLPITMPDMWSTDAIAKVILQEKKHRDGTIRLVLPVAPGQAVIHELPETGLHDVLTQALREP